MTCLPCKCEKSIKDNFTCCSCCHNGGGSGFVLDNKDNEFDEGLDGLDSFINKERDESRGWVEHQLNCNLTDNQKKQRKYLPTLSELIDRMSISQLKEFLISEYREEYSKEIQDILHDVDIEIDENNIKLDAKTIRAIIVLTIMNREIWLNESAVRKGTKDPSNLKLTHSLNAKRNTAKNKIQELIGGRKDFKIDNVEGYPEWDPSWD